MLDTIRENLVTFAWISILFFHMFINLIRYQRKNWSCSRKLKKKYYFNKIKIKRAVCDKYHWGMTGDKSFITYIIYTTFYYRTHVVNSIPVVSSYRCHDHNTTVYGLTTVTFIWAKRLVTKFAAWSVARVWINRSTLIK